MKDIIKRILSWLPIIILGWLTIDAIFFTPLVRWEWGFYNIEMLVVVGIMIIYMIWLIHWKQIKIIDLLEEIKKLKEKGE